jgi:hypothetical protein
MATGRDTQLTKQIGEYLVAAELGRRGYTATTFTGNVPYFDILAADAKGRTLAIQVKAIRGSTWQFGNARQFIDIQLDGEKQILGKPTDPPQSSLICVFVALGTYGSDRFFVFDWIDLQNVIVSQYHEYLERKDGFRPKRHDSFHVAVPMDALTHFEDSWSIIEDALNATSYNRG